MRVSLPVDPHYKTSSGVATLDLIYKRTTIPVPKVIAHEASNENELGFEWILMEYMVRRITSMPFFWVSHLSLDVYRGPFKSSTDWLTTKLALLKHDTDQPLSSDADSDDEEERDLIKEMIILLHQLMPQFFPAGLTGNEDFALHHDDISRRSIMVNLCTEELTALVDWECVSFVPLWKVCQLPWVLESRKRTSEPQKDRYTHIGDEPDEL